jgi:hypothetical protein
LDFLYVALNRSFQARFRIDDIEEGRQNVPTDSNSPPNSHISDLPAGVQEVFQSPPDIQLNISSDHFSARTIKKGHEILVAQVVLYPEMRNFHRILLDSDVGGVCVSCQAT